MTGAQFMTLTPKQQIAQLESQIARLRDKDRRLENGQKIILGGMLLAAARHDPQMAQWIVLEAAKAITRDVDRKRLQPLLGMLVELHKIER